MNTNKMQEFLGKESIENDESWSELVWRAGYAAAVEDAVDIFKAFGSIPFDADEVVDQLEKLK